MDVYSPLYEKDDNSRVSKSIWVFGSRFAVAISSTISFTFPYIEVQYLVDSSFYDSRSAIRQLLFYEAKKMYLYPTSTISILLHSQVLAYAEGRNK